MSRSRRKRTITGVTTARSEKRDKFFLHKKLRAKTKRLLRTDHLMKDHDEVVFPIEEEVMDVWSMSKDGKMGIRKVIRKPECKGCINQLNCMVRNIICREMDRYLWYRKLMRK